MMGLSSALANSLAGLRTTQSQIEIVSQNVANADSAGYSKRRASIVQQVTGDQTSGVRIASINRVIDTVVQKQLRVETAGAAYSDVRADFYSRIDQIFGQPGSSTSLDASFNDFTSKLQALTTDPGSYTARVQTLQSVQNLANRVNTASADIQALRDGAEARIASSVDRLNTVILGIDRINKQIAGTAFQSGGEGNAALQDERDRLVNELSGLVDIQVLDQTNGTVNILTNSGLQLIGGTPAQFSFDRRYNLSANNVYSPDPTQRGVGAISLIGQGGLGSDIVGARLFRSGEIASLVEMRDTVLVEAQNQLDDFAAGLAETTSNRQVASTAIPNGFSVDTAGVQPGNQFTFDFLTPPSTTPQRFVITRADSATAQTIANATSNSAQTVIGVNLSAGLTPAAIATIQGALNTQFGAGNFTVSATGTGLEITSVTRPLQQAFGSVSNTGITEAPPNSVGPALPLFTDAASLSNYTGSFENGFSQRIGFGQRITINPAVLNDPAALVKILPTTPNGDATRPQFLLDRLTQTTRLFSPTTGIGTNGNPFNGTVAEFARRIVEDQGANSANAVSIDEGQRLVLTGIEKKMADSSGVNIDEELSELVQVQNAYAANARIISTVRELFDTLLRI
jgi:flagellar hook-associated protein 1